MGPLLLRMADPPVETPLPGVSTTRAYRMDTTGRLHVLHTTESPNSALLHRIDDGPDEPAVCLADPFGVWIPWSIQLSRAGADTLFALATALFSEQSGVALLRLESGQPWALEDLGVATDQVGFTLTEDDTPLASLLAATVDGVEAWLRDGDGWRRLPFDYGHELSGAPAIVAGPRGADWLMASTYRGIYFSVPDEPDAFQVEGIARLNESPNCRGDGNECTRVCTLQSQGIPGLPAVVRDADGELFVHLDITLDRESQDVGEPCSEAGCNCEHVVTADRSTYALAIARYNRAARRAEPLWRMSLPAAPRRFQVARQPGGDLVIMLDEGDRIRLGRLPAAALNP